MRIDERTFITPSSKKLEFSVFSSPFHIEILPTEMGNMDRLIIQDLVKEFSSSRQIIECSRPFKVVIVLDAGSLTRDAQQALRRTMEKSAKNVRFIFITDNTSKIIAPLRSRCMCFRCPVVPRSIVSSIIQNFKPIDEFGSLRRNLLVADSQTPRFWWEDTIGQLIEELKRKTNPGFCSEVRKLLSLIIVNSIPKKEFMKVHTEHQLNLEIFIRICKGKGSRCRTNYKHHANLCKGIFSHIGLSCFQPDKSHFPS